jgi:hypothetical protein
LFASPLPKTAAVSSFHEPQQPHDSSEMDLTALGRFHSRICTQMYLSNIGIFNADAVAESVAYWRSILESGEVLVTFPYYSSYSLFFILLYLPVACV